MNPKKLKPKNNRTMTMIHPNAAAIDIGATMHTAAVNHQAPSVARGSSADC